VNHASAGFGWGRCRSHEGSGTLKNKATAPAGHTARGVGLFTTTVTALMLAACSTSGPQTASVKRTATKEYFAESEYGVKASPRVSMKRSGLPRGGGREQVGKPYKVKGKWYHPKEDPDYR